MQEQKDQALGNGMQRHWESCRGSIKQGEPAHGKEFTSLFFPQNRAQC